MLPRSWEAPGCGNGDWGTTLFWAKWGGVIPGSVVGALVGGITGPATQAMVSFQVHQSEQASVQGAFMVVGMLSSSLGGLYFTDHYLDIDATSWNVIKFAIVGNTMMAISTVMFVSRPNIEKESGC